MKVRIGYALYGETVVDVPGDFPVNSFGELRGDGRDAAEEILMNESIVTDKDLIDGIMKNDLGIDSSAIDILTMTKEEEEE